MLEIKGKYNSCIIYNDCVEESAMKQIYALLNCPAMANAKIRIMPDIHAGAGCVIGYTATLTDKIVPNLIGVDINCGVWAWNLGKIEIDFKTLDNEIRNCIPHGLRVRAVEYKDLAYLYNLCIGGNYRDYVEELEQVCNETKQDSSYVKKSIMTLGGGNHFLELDKDEDGNTWLAIHSGSRNFGLKIALYHQKLAKDKLGKMNDLEYLEGSMAQDYFRHMKVAQKFARLNRYAMAAAITEYLGLVIQNLENIESAHNYIDFENGIIRKGAISAQKDEKVVIPFNMKDGLIIGKGLGDPEWNYSAPHGSGRVLARGEAKRTLNLDKFKEDMKDVWTSCVSENTIDESPDAYKKTEDILQYLTGNVEIIKRLKPVYNFKAED